MVESREDRLARKVGDPMEWIGVDLDGTLATYDTWTAWNVFGQPIVPMVGR